MARLLLVRHGESAWNAEGRWQGWADPPPSPMGEAQATAVPQSLAGGEFQAVVTSDLQRARRTAEVVAAGLGLPLEVETGLRERDVGRWEGLTAAEIEERWPGALAAWHSGALASPPGGEPDRRLSDRALSVLRGLAARPASALLVVTHGGLLGAVERRLGLPRARTPNLCGRWFHPVGGGLAAGEPFAVSVSPDGAGAPSLVAEGGGE